MKTSKAAVGVTKIPEYVEEYLALKYPKYRDNKESLHASIRKEFMRTRGITNEEEFEDYIIKSGECLQDVKDQAISAADHSILNLLGTNVEEVQAMLLERRKKRQGGMSANHASLSRTEVFCSFLNSEVMGLSFAETIKAADALETSVDPKTFRTWLKELIKWKACSIPPPTRQKIRK